MGSVKKKRKYIYSFYLYKKKDIKQGTEKFDTS